MHGRFYRLAQGPKTPPGLAGCLHSTSRLAKNVPELSVPRSPKRLHQGEHEHHCAKNGGPMVMLIVPEYAPPERIAFTRQPQYDAWREMPKQMLSPSKSSG